MVFQAVAADLVVEVQVEAGKNLSPIIQAIADCEALTTGEIRVHMSRRYFDGEPARRAHKIFDELQMFRTTHRNAVLLYVNLKKRTFAVHADEGFYQRVNQTRGAHYWNQVALMLQQDLLSTHYERAISRAVRRIGFVLAQEFPSENDPLATRTDELSNEVTHD